MTDYSKDSRYVLKEHRYHLFDRPAPVSGRRFGPDGLSSSEVADQHIRRMKQSWQKLPDLDVQFHDMEQGRFGGRGLSRQHPDKQSAMRRFYDDALAGEIDASHVRAGLKRTEVFAHHLTTHLLEGEHGDQEYSEQLAQMAVRLPVTPLMRPVDNASFVQNPLKTAGENGHAIQISPWNLGLSTVGAAARRNDTSFYRNPLIVSPEAVYAHEYAHALDYWLTSLKQPGVNNMRHGLEWGHVSRGMGEAAQVTPGGVLALPVLNPPYTRLHYPSNGSAKPDHPRYQAEVSSSSRAEREVAEARRRLAVEWPTVMTELRLHDPSALSGLDAVFGRDAQGRTAGEIVDQFWGFQFPEESHPELARQYATDLRARLSPENTPLVGFSPITETSAGLGGKL